MPVPGRFIERFASEKTSPFLIFWEAIMLLRAIGLFFFSDGDYSFIPDPEIAFSIFRIAVTIAFNSSGSNDAL